MKFTMLSVAAAALCFSTVAAQRWEYDPRCPEPENRRLQHEKDGPEFLGETDQLSQENDLHLFENDIMLSSTEEMVQVNNTGKQLRGARNLADVTTFQMKMYWEEGYCWQSEWRERRWCLQCQGGSCGYDDYLWIKECSNSQRQRFVYREISGSGGGQLRPYTRQDLCWERSRVNAHQLRDCDGNEPKQIIKGISFSGKFEMHPNGKPDDCLEVQHHPKDEEIVRGHDCERSRRDKTSYWEMINVNTGSGDDDDDDVDSAPLPGGSSIVNLGREFCEDNGPCNKCQGDCDNDSQCAGDLRCFIRDGNQKVPGCDGGDGDDTRGIDFCYDADQPPSGGDDINYLGREYCSSSRQCARCQGDCDSDSHCQGNLKCYFREGNEPVPGCRGGNGSDLYGKDFCYDDSGGSSPPGSYDINNLGREACDRQKCEICQGDCDNDSQCKGDLRCFQRNGNEEVPGCRGGNGEADRGVDFCYDPKGNRLTNRGHEYCDAYTCGECEGDCDSDTQCRDGLKCFYRGGHETVPGCSGGTEKADRGVDFCYDPSKGSEDGPSIKDNGSEYCDRYTCGLCEGDCDNDDQCAGNLKCFMRDEYEAVPGCKGAEKDGSRSDYCYDENYK